MSNIHRHRDIISVLLLSPSLPIFLILSVFFLPFYNETTAPRLVDKLKRNTAISREKRKTFTARNKNVPQAEADKCI
jgi:hypothetical protein